ncbi:hypothetical protein GGX14DRAFT_405192 [Mycena pura]|uniref:Fe2OG dioxygenase domain-containing protein n=1 Tax=Mycena pura TaxID=153505 RepID=A0AAD6UWK1_9AGAR|nr:hypothetical protein GGX14DRAFT_405192 [Mycena pura]
MNLNIAKVSRTIEIQTKSTLSKKLEKLTAVLSTAFRIYADNHWMEEQTIKIAGEDAGTIWAPKVDVILSKSTASPFGKGDETVLDPEYRNGREVVAADVELGSFPENDINEAIQKALFPGESRKVSLSLYKLAIYEKGGHFDWHRDTTHSDDHHATVLVALNTSWSGGDLKLRRENVTVSPDMHTKMVKLWAGGTGRETLGAVAFFTDIEHMVEPVTEGVRIILQFDVHVSKAEEVKEKDEDKDDEDEDDEDEDNEDKDNEGREEGFVAEAMGVHCENPDLEQSSLPLSSAANDANMLEIIDAIKELHADGVYEVGFPLQHLYRKASIAPEYLKCTDARLYAALDRVFRVSLHPVMLEECSDYDGKWKRDEITGLKFDLPESQFGKFGEDDDDEEDNDSGRPKKKAKVQKIFYLSKISPLFQISSVDYIDHTGNEAQPAENKYYGAGYFVTAKEEGENNTRDVKKITERAEHVGARCNICFGSINIRHRHTKKASQRRTKRNRTPHWQGNAAMILEVMKLTQLEDLQEHLQLKAPATTPQRGVGKLAPNRAQARLNSGLAMFNWAILKDTVADPF